MIEMKGTFHAFAAIGTKAPETKQILLENIDFINKQFDQALQSPKAFLFALGLLFY